MLVNCKCCGNKIERESAYKVMTDKGNKYYCSQAEYEAMQKEKADKDAIYAEIVDIFGYKIQNSALFKEWKCWNELASNEKILSYIQENKDYIKGAVGKLNSTEYARIRYMSAILKNNLKDYAKNRGKRAQLPVFDDAMPQEVVEDIDYIMPINKKKKVERRKGFGE